MFFIFKNIIKEYHLDKTWRHGLELLKSGHKEEALSAFYSVVDQGYIFNPCIRRQIIILSKELNKKVNLAGYVEPDPVEEAYYRELNNRLGTHSKNGIINI